MPKLIRDRTLPALCPFCRAEIRRPVEVEGGEWYDFAAESCTCGAVFLQALLMAADGDMDRAMGMAEGVDYTSATSKNITVNSTAWNPIPSGPCISSGCGP